MTLELPRVFEQTYTVTDEFAVHFMGGDAEPVLATPMLVAWMEMTSRENVKPLLGPGEDTVGVRVHIRHLAATPVGMKVRIVSRLLKVEGRTYTLDVEAFDEVEKVGEAEHDRAVVNVAKFSARVVAKREKASGAR
jgi:predicted thioesterase